MLKKELHMVFHSWKFYFILGLFILFVMYDMYLCYGLTFLAGAPDKSIWIPAAASYLSGNSHGHVPQMLLEWILPLYLLVVYGDSFIREHKYHYTQILITRTGRKEVYKAKFITAFISGFLVFMIPLILNYIAALILFRDGVNSPMADFMNDGPILHFSILYPNITYMIYIVVASIVAGLCCMYGLAVSMLIPNVKYVYCIVYVIWYIFLSCKYSIMFVTQPFIEYDWDYVIPGFLLFAGVTAFLMLLAYIKKVKMDEI